MKKIILIGSILLLLTTLIIGILSLVFYLSSGINVFLLLWALLNNFLIFIIFIISIIVMVKTAKKNRRIIEENTDSLIVPKKESSSFAISGLIISVMGLFLTSILVLFLIVRIYSLNNSYLAEDYFEVTEFSDDEGDYLDEEDEVVIDDKTIDDCTSSICLENVGDEQIGNYFTLTLLEKNITEYSTSLKFNIENTTDGYLRIESKSFGIVSTSDEYFTCLFGEMDCKINGQSQEEIIVEPNSEIEIEVELNYDITFGDGISEDTVEFVIYYFDDVNELSKLLPLPAGFEFVEVYY